MTRWLAIAALVAVMLAGAQGYRMGSAANEARHVAQALADEKNKAAANARLAIAEQKARLLAQELEDQAYAEPIESAACLPLSRVLRLNKR